MAHEVTEENRALIEALTRVSANPWPHRDESAEDTLLEAIEELVKLRKENAAMREIVQAVASITQLDTQLACGVCGGYRTSDSWGYPLAGKALQHSPACPIIKARAFLARSHE